MSQPVIERCTEFELRAAPDGDGRTLEGYAAVFDTPTRIDSWEGTFDEVIARGAFKKTIRERTPVLQFDHGHDARTGSVPIGAIEVLKEDSRGLFVRARLFDNPVVEPIRQAIEGGAINGMSFRFRVMRDEWQTPSDKDRAKGAVDLRTIREVQLFELGPVVFPAYEATSVGVRDQHVAVTGANGTITIGVPPTVNVVDVVDAVRQFSATSDDAVRTSEESDAADTSEDAGNPDPKRVAVSEVLKRALVIRGVIQ